MKRTQPSNAAFSLVEIVIAIGIASFSLISMLGLLPVGLSNTHTATTQTGAMNLMTALSADIRTATSGSSSIRFGINPTKTSAQTLYFDESGNVTDLQNSNARYKVMIQAVWQPSSNETVNRITITWPPQAPASNVMGSADAVVSYYQDYE
jgi:uncharacterized protein (TIGR02598 family)